MWYLLILMSIMREVHGNFFKNFESISRGWATSVKLLVWIQIFTQYKFGRPRSCSPTQLGHLPGSVYRSRGHNSYPTWWR